MDDREYEIERRRLALKEREMTLLEARHAFEVREADRQAESLSKAEDALGKLHDLMHDHDDDPNLSFNWPPRGRA